MYRFRDIHCAIIETKGGGYDRYKGVFFGLPMPFFKEGSMTDIKTFLNSKDIAEHWRKTGFVCTPVQAAYIIWQSHEKSLREKHEAWKELMETTPDCPFAEGRRKECMVRRGIPEALTDSLHAFLRAYMALEDRTLERFYREEANYCLRVSLLPRIKL